MLRALIRGATDFKNAIIFCNRKRDVATLQRSLAKHGFNAGALHGDMDQRSRTQTLDDFRKDKLTLLVASDVAARGLDIPAVSHIFNFDVPTHAEDYIHRIGRTGRAGLKGTSITIATSLDRKYVAAIEKMIGHPIPPMEVEAGAERAAAFSKGRGERGRSRMRAIAVRAVGAAKAVMARVAVTVMTRRTSSRLVLRSRARSGPLNRRRFRQSPRRRLPRSRSSPAARTLRARITATGATIIATTSAAAEASRAATARRRPATSIAASTTATATTGRRSSASAITCRSSCAGR